MSGIIKVYKQENPFEMIPRSTLQDERLSLQAIGLLVNICSYPESWQLQKTELYKRYRKNKETSVRNAWNELLEAGYAMERKFRNGKKWVYEYAIRTTPFTEEEKTSFSGTKEEETDDSVHILRTGFCRPQNEDFKMRTSKPRGNIYNNKENTHKENTQEYITHLSISENQKSFLLKHADNLKRSYIKAYEEIDGLIDDKYLLNSKFLDCIEAERAGKIKGHFKPYFKAALDEEMKQRKAFNQHGTPSALGDYEHRSMTEEERLEFERKKKELMNESKSIPNYNFEGRQNGW